MGLGMTCMGNLAWHRTVISSFDHWRGRAIFLGVLGASLAGVVMPPLVTNLVEAIGWRGSFVVFAIIVPSILIPLVIFFLKNRHEDIGEVRDGHAYSDAHKSAESADETETRIWHWKEMIRFPTSWSVGLTFGSMGCVYSAIMLHLFGHLKDIGLPGSEAAAILSATALFAALGKTIVGWISDFLAPG
jgi:cyanate permease